MNKNLIALAVAAAAFSSAASAAQIYSNGTSNLNIGGRIEARAVIQSTAKNSANAVTQQQIIDQQAGTNVQDQSRVRLNIQGDTDIGNGVQAVGRFEQEFTSGYEPEYTRYLYVGVKSHKYGQLVYGTADGSAAMVTNFTNIQQYAGGVLSDNQFAVGDRASNNLAYTGTFGNLTVAANYVFDGTAYDNNNNKTDVHGFATGAIYNIGTTGLALGLAYDQQKGQISAANTTPESHAEQTYAAISYTKGNFYYAAMYKYGKNDAVITENDTSKAVSSQGYSLAAAYTMGKTTFTTTYADLRTHSQGVSADNKDLMNQLAIDGTYNFTNNFSAYASYMFNFLSSSKVGKVAASDQAVFGARYNF